MLQHKLPTAPGRPFDDLPTAEKFLATCPLPVMIKADDPRGGEAVYHERYAALAGLRELVAARPLESDRAGVVIESFLSGPRVVLSAFVDGQTSVPLLATRLYDRVGVGDEGAQAAGIGAHTGCSRYARLLTEYLHRTFIQPIVAGLAEEGLPYWGILSVDCIITPEGPRLTAIRGSFHEGEAQVVLPRLEDDLLPWIEAMIARRLHELPPPRFTPTASIGVGLFASGYPHHYPSGGPIGGLETLDEGVLAFHSATEQPGSLRYGGRGATPLAGLLAHAANGAMLYTSGGHVLTVVAQGRTLPEARARALDNARRVTFEGRSFREDIGAREFA